MNENTQERQEHELKTWPEYYEKIETGEKTFEVRKHDRFFNVGDTLILKEWSPVRWQESGGYSGKETKKEITYVMNGGTWGIPEGICILGIASPAAPAYPRWVKANEEPPVHYESYFIRKIGQRGGGFAQADNDRKAFLNLHLFGPQGGKYSEFEYLQESPSPEVNVEELAVRHVQEFCRPIAYHSLICHKAAHLSFIAGYNAVLTPSR